MMLVALGVLSAALIVIGLLPPYRRRVQRLTSEEIRRSIPLTEAEIRADKDKLRAQYAIRVHKLEAEVEQQKLAAARQRIEMNRRDARLTELQDEQERMRVALEENVNARRVLEHTVTDRLPRLEQQLEMARGLIDARDNEMVSLKSESTRSVRALDDAMQLNAQQRAELERLSASLTSARMPGPERFAETRFDGEMALRSEIEALRAKTREQAQLIQRMQGGEAMAGSDVEQLRRELADAETALRSARESAQNGSFDRAAAEAQAKALNARIDEQGSEIARLNAALAVYEASGAGADDTADKRVTVPGNRLASKARASAMQAQLAQQNDTIQRLRAELAANNERLARQAAHYTEEMRRLGAGGVPTSLDPRRGREGGPRRGLADRISQGTRPAAPASAAGDAGPAEAAGATTARVAEYIKALNDEGASQAAGPALAALAASAGAAGEQAAERVLEPAAADGGEVKRKPRLLERISGAGKA